MQPSHARPQAGGTSLREYKRKQLWLRAAQIMAIGYSSMSRTFAYIGIFPAKLFISEIMLGWFLIRRSSALDWFFSRAKRNQYVEMLRISLILFILYGIFLLGYGCFVRPMNALPAFQNVAFNYYALYLVIGVWVAANNVLNMRQFATLIGWALAIYGTLYVLILNRMSTEIPGTPGVDFFGQPTGAAVAIMTMLAFEPRIKKLVIPCFLNLFVMVGVQVRSEWLGFLAAFTVWSFLARKMSRFFVIIGTAVLLMTVAYTFDLRMTGVANRGGEISVQGVIGRALAPFFPSLAAKYSDESEMMSGTVDWRKRWWAAIWERTNNGPAERMFFGEGYGYPIAEIIPGYEENIRTPHCVFYYCLGYGGWLGVATFFFFQIALLWSLYRVYKLTGQSYGVAIWIVSMAMGLLGNQFETPYGAIPSYLLMGMALKPLFVPRQLWEEFRRPRLARYVQNSPRPVRSVHTSPIRGALRKPSPIIQPHRDLG